MIQADSQNHYQQLFENLRDGIVTIDLEGHILSCNSAYERLTGYSAQELLTMTHEDITPKQWHSLEAAAIREQTLKFGFSKVFEKEYRRRDGTIIPVELQSYLLRDQAGKVIGFQRVVRDITEKKHAENALRESEERYRAIVEMAEEGIWVLDRNLHTTFINSRLADMFGYSQEEMLDELPEAFLFPEDIPDHRQRMQNRQNKISEKYERRFQKKNGEALWTIVSATYLVDGENTFYGASAMLTDITYLKLSERKLKAANEELEKSLSLLKATLDSTADGIIVIDRNEQISGYNQLFLDLWQIPKNFIGNRSYKEMLTFVLNQLKAPEKCLKRLQELMCSPEMEGIDFLEFKDGKIFERYTRPQRLGEKIIGRVFSYRDITSRKRNEEIIRQNLNQIHALEEISRTLAEARFDLPTILNSLAVKVASFFEDACILRLFNEDKTKLDTITFHHSDSDVRKLMSDMIGGEHSIIDQLSTIEMLKFERPVLVSGTPEEMHARVDAKFGPIFDRFPIHSWIIAPLRVAGVIIGTVTTVRFRNTDNYSTEDSIWLQEVADRAALSINNAQLYQEAQQAIQLREDFMIIASHELRTPITPLRLQLQQLSKLVQAEDAIDGPFEERIKKLIADSNRQLSRIIRLVEEILDTTRLSTGKMILKTEDVELSSLVSEVIEGLHDEFKSAKCDIEYNPTPIPYGNWDRIRIEQVVTNLLLNAIKFGAGKPVKIEVYFQNDKAYLSVQDFGIGIAVENQQRIFERLERAISSRNFGGLGMGLYIAQEIVISHGGIITVRSLPDQGSTFTVELPINIH